jgi:hypothetical protein
LKKEKALMAEKEISDQICGSAQYDQSGIE